MHRPVKDTKRQYRSAVWYVNDEQKDIAEEVIRQWKSSFGPRDNKLYTSVEPAVSFYKAEEYHQFFLSKSIGSRN
jgi:peptide-methionine (S)-S-oxide reductase